LPVLLSAKKTADVSSVWALLQRGEASSARSSRTFSSETTAWRFYERTLTGDFMIVDFMKDTNWKDVAKLE
jgi:hypothetical protein